MPDLMTINSPALPKGARVVAFRGSEGLSRLYAFEIHLTLGPDDAGAFDLPGAVGEAAMLAIDRQDGRPPFAFHGIFAEVSLVDDLDGHALVRALLVPRLWRLTQTQHSRVFTQQSVPDIIATVLQSGGLVPSDYSLRLSCPYAPEEHVCQYQESDLDFISRWMEREGLYYFFEQGDGGERLVIADDKAVHEPLVPTPVRFFPLAGADATARECLDAFSCRCRSLPASVRFKDHDYTKPLLDLSGSAPVCASGLGEISVHGGRFFTPDAGKRLARLRAEALRARAEVFTGSGTALYLRHGYTFSLEEHPRFDGAYLAVEVEHRGTHAASTPELRRRIGLEDEDVYRVEVTAIPASVQFRAEARTAWPRIYGAEHAIVDGEADSEYAQLDEQGRYVVRIAFDENAAPDGKASTRVRMMQPHGGSPEGWHFPLRKETEVLLTFLGGDPDRPVIAGVVPNAHTPSPVTAANRTKNRIVTGGRNRFELDDQDGRQQVTLATPTANTVLVMGAPEQGYELDARTDANAQLAAGNNWNVKVGANLTEHVAGTTTETYDGDHTSTCSANRTITVAGTYTQTCNGNVSRTMAADETDSVAGAFHATYGSQACVVKGDATRVVLGSETHNVAGEVTQRFGPVKGTWASLTLNIPGGAEIVTPKWEVTTPEHNWLMDVAKSIFGEDTEAAGTKAEFVGFSIEGTGLAVEAVQIHAETIGVELSNVVLKAERPTLELNTGSLTVAQKAVHIATAGLLCIG